MNQREDELLRNLQYLVDILRKEPGNRMIADFEISQPYVEGPTNVHDQVKKYHQPETFITIRILNKTEYQTLPMEKGVAE